MKAEAALPNMLVESLGDGFFGTVAYELLDHLASLEHKQRGDAGDFVAHGSGAVGVDVHFADGDFALIVLGELLDDGSDGAAGAAPGCPEVYQYGLFRFQNIRVEVCVGHFDDSVACHFLSPRCNVGLSADAPSNWRCRAIGMSASREGSRTYYPTTRIGCFGGEEGRK